MFCFVVKQKLLDRFFITEVIIASILSLNLIVGAVIADDWTEYWFEYYVLVDIVSIIPTFLICGVFPHDINYDTGLNFKESMNYAVYALRTTRILRMVRIHQKIDQTADLVKRWAWHRIMTVVIILVFGE